MATVVVVEASTGTLERYEFSAPKFVRTHGCSWGEPRTFTEKVVEDFRLMPPDEFKVDPPPAPTNPPADAGQLPCDVERAAA